MCAVCTMMIITIIDIIHSSVNVLCTKLRLIEEFMLLANMTVARVNAEAFPDSAMLRRHPKPKEKPAALLVTAVHACNIVLFNNVSLGVLSSRHLGVQVLEFH